MPIIQVTYLTYSFTLATDRFFAIIISENNDTFLFVNRHRIMKLSKKVEK